MEKFICEILVRIRGVFLNGKRLGEAGTPSDAFEVNNGDIIQMGKDFFEDESRPRAEGEMPEGCSCFYIIFTREKYSNKFEVPKSWQVPKFSSCSNKIQKCPATNTYRTKVNNP
jgi:hypothetical protein